MFRRDFLKLGLVALLTSCAPIQELKEKNSCDIINKLKNPIIKPGNNITIPITIGIEKTNNYFKTFDLLTETINDFLNPTLNYYLGEGKIELKTIGLPIDLENNKEYYINKSEITSKLIEAFYEGGIFPLNESRTHFLAYFNKEFEYEPKNLTHTIIYEDNLSITSLFNPLLAKEKYPNLEEYELLGNIIGHSLGHVFGLTDSLDEDNLMNSKHYLSDPTIDENQIKIILKNSINKGYPTDDERYEKLTPTYTIPLLCLWNELTQELKVPRKYKMIKN